MCGIEKMFTRSYEHQTYTHMTKGKTRLITSYFNDNEHKGIPQGDWGAILHTNAPGEWTETNSNNIPDEYGYEDFTGNFILIILRCGEMNDVAKKEKN